MRKFEAIRTEIKKLSDLQKVWKPLRKDSNRVQRNPEDLDSSQWYQQAVGTNKYELRHLFQAYAILKGIERPEVKKPSNYNGWILDQKKIDEMVEKFKLVEVKDEVSE